MSERYPGGIISKTAPVPTGPLQNGTAPGIWTLDQQAAYAKQGIWPTAGNVDPSLFIENLFSTWLYTGTGANQTITNGIDLSGKGGLVWIKDRNSGATGHALFDTARGVNKKLQTQSTNGEFSGANQLTAFNATGFDLGSATDPNGSGTTYASWTFREQSKFFDVVTYTGDGSSYRTITHALGSTPGVVIAKRTDSTGSWFVWHTSLGKDPANSNGVYFGATLNTTDAAFSTVVWGDTRPSVIPNFTTTAFSVGGNLNLNGATYVAYVFATNAGGFGLTGTDNVISCGSFTTDGGGGATVNLGYEPQWILYKESSNTGENWSIADTMRGMPVTGNVLELFPNNASSESTAGISVRPNATGFTFGPGWYASRTFIYIAIRRGPMKVPTTGTSVFEPVAYTGNGANRVITSNFPVDLALNPTTRTGTNAEKTQVFTRLTGTARLSTSSTAAEVAPTTNVVRGFDSNIGLPISTSGDINGSTLTYVNWLFRRAPGYFDVVCWTGDGTGAARNHNLTVYPELVISKLRNGGAGFGAWGVQNNINPSAKQTGVLNTTAAFSSSGATSPTATVFYPSDDQSGANYVTYLFASAPGVSKVGSYTGTGTTQQINCGFTAGSRFVLIKRTDSTGDWYVWDSARGIVAGNDPYLLLNSTAAEVTSTDYVDTFSSGFEISSTAPAAINANGGTYIFLAIA
jgi:hypothetical protein